MSKYTVKFYKGNYWDRQHNANRDKAIVYLEQHFNAASSDAKYALAIVATNASQTSKNFGIDYAEEVKNVFPEVLEAGAGPGLTDNILVGGYNGRGNSNIKHTDMPAVLLEPLFGSTPSHADLIRSEEGQWKLAQIISSLVQKYFPDGGLVAFSVGHLYKRTSPKDKGSLLHGGGYEGDYAERVLLKAQQLLEGL